MVVRPDAESIALSWRSVSIVMILVFMDFMDLVRVSRFGFSMIAISMIAVSVLSISMFGG
jgi:hypothetical protein